MQSVLSRAIFRGPPVSGQKYFTVLSLHIKNMYAKEKDTVSKGFVNSTEVVSAPTSPRNTIEITCNQVNFLRIHDDTKSEDELLGNVFLTPPGPTPLWRPGSIPDSRETFADFSNHLAQIDFGKCINMVLFFYSMEIAWATSHRSKLPSRNLTSPGCRRLEEQVVQARCV